MEWKRRTAFLLACLVIPFLLISCGGREEEGGAAEPEGAKEETAETSPGVIAYVDGFDIWIVDVESGDKSMVTDSSYRDYAPSISPDGARIAFTREDESRNVFIVNCDGTGLERLTRGTPGDDFSPAWSPRGDTLAYLSTRDHPEEGLPYAEVYLMDPDGGNQRRLSASEHGLENPGALWWSPEGDEIAVWEMGSGAGTGIALVDVSTGEVSRPERLYRILEERGYLQSAVNNYVLNPRNVDLAACTLTDLASAPTGEKHGLFIMDLADGESVKVTDPVMPVSCGWSLDGDYLYYTDVVDDGRYGFFMVRKDGTEKRFLDHLPRVPFHDDLWFLPFADFHIPGEQADGNR